MMTTVKQSDLRCISHSAKSIFTKSPDDILITIDDFEFFHIILIIIEDIFFK